MEITISKTLNGYRMLEINGRIKASEVDMGRYFEVYFLNKNGISTKIQIPTRATREKTIHEMKITFDEVLRQYFNIKINKKTV